ncbi:MAG: RecX family transcriptional regulator [Eubacterium sp.]|nr:RecX family transcriptional regulator [Eubacterium sp.]
MIISHNKGRGRKIHILADGEYALTTDVDFWADHYIKDGSEISEEEWAEFVSEANYRKAVNKCFDFLSRRDYSVKELRGKLLKTVDADSADRAIERMLELDYLDDERYAESLLNHLINNKKMSSSFIRQEMLKRGISRDTVDALLSETEIDNVSVIAELIVKKYRTKLEAENGRDKVIAALMRKGFTYSDIKAAFRELEE